MDHQTVTRRQGEGETSRSSPPLPFSPSPCLRAGVFRDLGSRYIERLGTGVRRMAQAMAEHGLPRPRFEDVGSEFRVTLVGPGERFMEEVGKRPAWAKGLNERQVEAMLYAGEHGRITNRAYQDLCGVSRETVKRDLRELVRKKLLTSVGSGRGLYYVLTQL